MRNDALSVQARTLQRLLGDKGKFRESQMQLPLTTTRVERNTPDSVNDRIREQTKANVVYFSEHPHEIDERLRELDQEWDIERTLEANASTIGLIGIALGGLLSRRWLFLPAAVAGFLLQHALQGWCPPVAVFRRRGVRTMKEINHERLALKVLRGDFDDLPHGANRSDLERAQKALQIVQ